MNLLQIKQGSVLYGQPPLLDSVDFNLQTNERVCIVGRNGSGKSTFLKILSGEIKLDDGNRLVSGHIKIARLEQDPPTHTDITLFDYVAEGLAKDTTLIKEYFAQLDVIANDSSESALNKLQKLQEQLEASNAWQLEQRISNTLTQLNLDGSQNLNGLSGGWRRKAALARALVSQPDVLLLDEPTNHLDIEMVKWLEQAVKQYSGAIIFISHDRAFIRAIATRIVDIDRGQLTSYDGNYDNYLQKKAHDLEVQETQNKEFDKKLAKEEAWIRQGIKARRTRNEGRVRALKKLRDEFKNRRNQTPGAVIKGQVLSPSGKRVFELNKVSYGYVDKPIAKEFDCLVTRGDKIALIGPNGCGKSTLIKLLLGEIKPQNGSIFVGANLEVAYFDQHRNKLDLNKSLIDEIADGKREVEINGVSRHVISYLQDYLFSPERINAPVSTLSGGERNRLMLAKLMLKPHNVLILDEPTNDLDVETLELLESLLVDYTGTLILVSHDREFINNVVSTSLYFESPGNIKQFVGGYDDVINWYEHSGNQNEVKPIKDKQLNLSTNERNKTNNVERKKKKLSYNEQRELDRLPKTIEQLEERVQALQNKINQADFFNQEVEYTQSVLDELATCENELEQSFSRWDELETIQNTTQ